MLPYPKVGSFPRGGLKKVDLHTSSAMAKPYLRAMVVLSFTLALLSIRSNALHALLAAAISLLLAAVSRPAFLAQRPARYPKQYAARSTAWEADGG